MTCEEIHDLLHGYLDGELDLAHHLQIEEHLHECATCAEAYQQQQELRAVLREPALYQKAPPHLADRIRTQLQPRRSMRLPWRTTVPNPVVVAASIALVAVLVWGALHFLEQRSLDDQLAAEIVSSHVRSLQAQHLLDVPSSDQHTVKPWFAGRVDFAPVVKNFAEQGFNLVGGRLDYLDQRPVAALVYQHRQHIINVFVWPATTVAEEAPRPRERQGYHLIHWTQAGLTYWAVSDLNETELQHFVELLRS